MSGMSEAEQDALLKAMPYRTVSQRRALIITAFSFLPVTPSFAPNQGFATPAELLRHLLGKIEESGISRGRAIGKLLNKSDAYGNRGEIGAVKLYEVRPHKKLVRWIPPGWPSTPGSRLTLARLFEAIATNGNGQTVPSWLLPAQWEPMGYGPETYGLD